MYRDFKGGLWVGGIKTFAIFRSRVLYSTCYLQTKSHLFISQHNDLKFLMHDLYAIHFSVY